MCVCVCWGAGGGGGLENGNGKLCKDLSTYCRRHSVIKSTSSYFVITTLRGAQAPLSELDQELCESGGGRSGAAQ